jgi:fucose 4-O-acetylase-like acetyltransferase
MSLQQTNKRLSYIDWAKAIAIALICIGHFLPGGNTFKVIFYTFHVPIFAFISGLLSKAPTTLKELGSRLLRLCTRIFVPYVIWHFISGIISVHQEFRDWNQVFKSFFFLNGMTVWNDALWYAPSIFMVCVVFTLFCYLVKGNKFAVLGLGCASLGTFIYFVRHSVNIRAFGNNNFLGTRNLVMLLGFVCIGYACKEVIKFVVSFKENPYKNYLLYISAGIFAISIFLVDKVNHKNPISLLYGDYNNPYHFVFFALTISLSLILACALLPESKIVASMSRHSLFIMCSHYIFLLELVWNTVVTASDDSVIILWSLGINVVLFYAIVCPLVDFLCDKVPFLKKIFYVFGFGY